MAISKRCIFCGKKLREDGYCANVNCVDYARTKIRDEKEERNEIQNNFAIKR